MKSRPPPQTLLLFSSSTINYSHKGLIPPHTRQTITSESQRTMHMTYSTHRQTVHMANSHIALIPFVNPVRPFPPTVSSPSPPPVHKYHLSPLLSFTSILTFMNILSYPVSLIATPMKDAQSRWQFIIQLVSRSHLPNTTPTLGKKQPTPARFCVRVWLIFEQSVARTILLKCMLSKFKAYYDMNHVQKTISFKETPGWNPE